MGLLDLLANQTYGDNGGGLLSYLQSPLYRPPAAIPFPGMSQSAPEQPPHAAPIAIGNYMMPRIGAASAYEPQQNDIPPNAQPTQGQMPQMTASQPALGGRPGGFLGQLSEGLQSIGNGGSVLGALTGNFTDPVSAQKQNTNMTVRALIQKGVDPQIAMAAVQPGNTELLKQIFDRHFGAPKPPTALGSGYIYNPQTNKVERAYEPEDKIPAGFVKGDDGNMHFIPGGPADPAYLRTAEAQKKDPNAPLVLGRGGEVIKNNPDGTVTVLHKNAQNETEPMEPDSLEVLARREIGGDFGGRKNLGRGAQGAADLKAITNKSTEILTKEMGMTPAQAADHLSKKQQEYTAQGQGLNSEARTTGVREANLNLILKATDAAIPAALEASDKVARTGWVPVNKIIQGGQVMASSPELKQFGMANLQLAEHWARAMNPTGVMREADRDLALHFLSTADSKETYKAAVGQLRTQIERERDAVKSSRGMSDLPGNNATSHTPQPPAAAPAAGSYVWTPDAGLKPK